MPQLHGDLSQGWNHMWARCVNHEIQIYKDPVVIPKCIISEWFHSLKTKHQAELKAQCFHRHLLFIRAQNGENVIQRFSSCPGPTQDWSHSAQACNNPQSWSDTSSIASSEAGAHAENLLLVFMGISISEVFTLCSNECKISASLTANSSLNGSKCSGHLCYS